MFTDTKVIHIFSKNILIKLNKSGDGQHPSQLRFCIYLRISVFEEFVGYNLHIVFTNEV